MMNYCITIINDHSNKMKTLVLLLALCIGTGTYAQTFKARQLMGTKTQVLDNNVTYEKDLDYSFVEVDGTKQETYLQLSRSQRDTVKMLLLKFKDMAMMSEGANVTTDRPLGNFVSSAGFRIGETIYTNPAVTVDLYFYSYAGKGKVKPKSELSLTVNSFVSSKNKDMMAGQRTIILSSAGVNQLLNCIDNEKIAERQKAKEKENEIIR